MLFRSHNGVHAAVSLWLIRTALLFLVLVSVVEVVVLSTPYLVARHFLPGGSRLPISEWMGEAWGFSVVGIALILLVVLMVPALPTIALLMPDAVIFHPDASQRQRLGAVAWSRWLRWLWLWGFLAVVFLVVVSRPAWLGGWALVAAASAVPIFAAVALVGSWVAYFRTVRWGWLDGQPMFLGFDAAAPPDALFAPKDFPPSDAALPERERRWYAYITRVRSSRNRTTGSLITVVAGTFFSLAVGWVVATWPNPAPWSGLLLLLPLVLHAFGQRLTRRADNYDELADVYRSPPVAVPEAQAKREEVPPRRRLRSLWRTARRS
ncbi:hypothetical protein GCM10022288_15590 [Gryllotalpicola kribbensis]|uniref:Transmembrane protein n=2 Tax=Gryllotalpicola kribbensis TaxID=993084 RepID=A0ABP8ARJ6_9MICO